MSTETLNDSFINQCIQDRRGPVALHFREILQPVEGPGGVFFPATYAGIGYNVDTLADGTKVVTVDSVGSQANRMEPVFLHQDLQELVPQINIRYEREDKSTGTLSLLEAGHRLGDAVVRCTSLQEIAHEAFRAQQRSGDSTQIAKLAPTSLVFGAWDSRDTQAKVPRLVQSVIRAWDISELTRSAQFNPALDYAELAVFGDAEKQKAEGNSKSPLAQRGYVHVPATGAHGGVVAKGEIRRDLTINLVALRQLRGSDEQLTLALRRYILGLCLIAALEPQEAFLRQGCLLVPDQDKPPSWTTVTRSGERLPTTLDLDQTIALAKSWAKAFGVGQDRPVDFDKRLAKADAKKKN